MDIFLQILGAFWPVISIILWAFAQAYASGTESREGSTKEDIETNYTRNGYQTEIHPNHQPETADIPPFNSHQELTFTRSGLQSRTKPTVDDIEERVLGWRNLFWQIGFH